jgi:hypothetical protein
MTRPLKCASRTLNAKFVKKKNLDAVFSGLLILSDGKINAR